MLLLKGIVKASAALQSQTSSHVCWIRIHEQAAGLSDSLLGIHLYVFSMFVEVPALVIPNDTRERRINLSTLGKLEIFLLARFCRIHVVWSYRLAGKLLKFCI